MSHFEELTYLRYLEKRLDPLRSDEMSRHVEECRECQRLLASLDIETRLIREALIEVDEPLPARLAPAQADNLSWAAIFVIVMATAGLYTLWNGIFLPWWERLESVGLSSETFLAMALVRGVLWEGWSSMGQELMRGIVFFVSLVAVFSFVRWSLRFMRASTPNFIGLAALLVLPSVARAVVYESDKDLYVLAEDRIIEDDLIVTGRSARIEGTLDGDLVFFGQSVIVTGRVTGDVIAFCQRVRIEGQVGGSVRSGSETLEILGRVERNVTSGGDTIELDKGAHVGGSFIAGGGQVIIDGSTGRGVLVGADSNTINGVVGGNMKVAAENLTVGSSAEIRGGAQYYGVNEPEVSPDATLATPLELKLHEEVPEYASVGTYVKGALKWAAAFVFGLVAMLVLPAPYRRVVQTTSQYGSSIAIGAAAFVVVPVVAALVCATLVGLPIGLAALFLYVVALYAAQVFVGSWIGSEVLGMPANKSQALGQMALGLLFIHIVGHIPYVGTLTSLVILFWGLGALLLAVYRQTVPVTLTA
jgi:cytoskeletal protein CcmA (bactofilin family)